MGNIVIFMELLVAGLPPLPHTRGTCVDRYIYKYRYRCRYSYGGKERGRIGSEMVRIRAIAREKEEGYRDSSSGDKAR